MSRAETQEQRLTTKRQKMPGDLADLHWHLEAELTILHFSWKEYKVFFAAGQAHIDLINATAPSFFMHFEDMAWGETLLHLCRLTDPPKSAGKNTLTVLSLARMIDDTKLKAKVEQEAEAAKQATAFARDWRNRRLAHRSLEHALDPQLKPLATARRADVEKALAALRQVMNSVSVHYESIHNDFESVIAPSKGAKALLRYLSKGLEADEARKNAGT